MAPLDPPVPVITMGYSHYTQTRAKMTLEDSRMLHHLLWSACVHARGSVCMSACMSVCVCVSVCVHAPTFRTLSFLLSLISPTRHGNTHSSSTRPALSMSIVCHKVFRSCSTKGRGKVHTQQTTPTLRSTHLGSHTDVECPQGLLQHGEGDPSPL